MTISRSRFGSTTVRCVATAGYTLIELLIVIGVVGTIVGMILPAVRASRYQARAAAASATLRQNAVLVEQYSQQSRDVYPLSDSHPAQCVQYWFRPLVSAGLIARDQDADPAGWRSLGTCSFQLSLCTIYNPALMEPGRTITRGAMQSSPVRTDQIVFPSAKGILNQHLIHYSGWGFTKWIESPPLPAPIQFADGSGDIGAWSSYACVRTPSGGIYTENEIGYPVMSSWGGFKARDR
jgi:type II secretory pathway pseudopilin PulG